MPSTHTPAAIDRVYGSAVTALLDGDAVDRDSLYVEASPGATPKLTLGYLLSCVDGILASTAQKVAAYTGTSFTITAGPLQTYLRLLADKAPRLDKSSNDFAGRIGVGTDVDIGQDLTVAGALSVTGGTALSTLSCSGVSALSTLSCSGGTALSTLSCSGAVSMSSTLGVTGALTVGGSASVTGSLSVGSCNTGAIAAPATAGFALTNGTRASDAATFDLTFTTQNPFASALANKKPGNFVISIPAAAGGSTADADQGAFVLKSGGSDLFSIHQGLSLGSSTGTVLEARGGTDLRLGTLESSTADTRPSFLGTGDGTGRSSGNVYIRSGSATGAGKSTGHVFVCASAGFSSAKTGNVILCHDVQQDNSGAQNAIVIGTSVANPTSSPSGGGGILYVDVSTDALKWRGSSGTITTIAPADPHCPSCGRDFALEFEHPDHDEALTICLTCMVSAMSEAGINTSWAHVDRRNADLTPEARRHVPEARRDDAPRKQRRVADI